MANYNKSFNFRNGVQVDDDNFIVNANGLVGIGTSIPTEFLDVHGTAKVTGLVTARNLAITGVSTFYSDVKVGSGITMYASTGIVSATAFYGDGSNLLNVEQVAVNGWIVTAGSISTAAKVGIGTTNPQYSLQVGQDPLTGNGFSVDALTANVNTTGIITATKFSGPGDDISNLNASLITSGTLDNARLPQNITISGSITANSGIITSINSTGISTFGIANASQLYVSGVTTSTNGFVGNVIGIASTARSLTGTPDITVGTVIATTINVGSAGTAFSALNSGRIGVGTALPTSEFQIRKSSDSLLEVIADSGQSRISIGQSVGVGKSTAVLRFGNTAKTFDIINRDTGNINTIIHGGPSGVGTGRFVWVYGQDNSEKMSLTYDGKLGLGITNPTNSFHVVGTSTITSNSYVGDTLYVKNDIYLNTLRANSVASNTYVTSGVSTFSTINLNGGSNILTIGTNDAGSYKFKIEDGLDAYLGTKVKLGSQNGAESTYFGSNLAADASLLKVFGGLYARTFYVDTLSSTTLTVGTGVTISGGIVTATTFVGTLTGTATTTTNVPNLTGAITSNNTTTSLGSFTSAQLATALSDETGSGANVFATSPTLVNPILGSATATSIIVGSGVTITSGIVTAVNGFSSGIGTAVKITTVGDRVYFTVAGVGVTSLQLF